VINCCCFFPLVITFLPRASRWLKFLLEMIPGEPDSLSGGWNEEFTRPLIEHRKYGECFTEGEREREIIG